MTSGTDMPTGRDRPPDTDIRVLCVDTDETVGEHLDSHLETDRVRTLESPREALTDVRDETVPVDSLVSEYQLPEMDGLAFLEAVRVENPTLPFILFTGSPSETLASNAIAADVTDYVRKDAVAPYDRLATCVTGAVARARRGRAHEAGDDRPTPDEHLDRRAAAMDDIFPVVRETGHWRGEAVGTRTDGTTFPQ